MLDEEFLKEFGLRVKFYRLRRNLTQAQLGEKINISENRISEIENGRCNLTLKTVNRLSIALGFSAYKFFNFEEI
ncbi:MAG: helix-turn-helix transcriptional regulator [Candidatus Gastranaerophilales bacterium]|nr:helix-turn-helix transcriptional regulator [Candidatus Gastranaerophilales bacterium]